MIDTSLHTDSPASEQYLASWLCLHSQPDGLPQREYARLCAVQQGALALYRAGDWLPAMAPSDYDEMADYARVEPYEEDRSYDNAC